MRARHRDHYAERRAAAAGGGGSRSPSPLPKHLSGGGWTGSSLWGGAGSGLAAVGYEQYQKSLLEVPWSHDYGEASSDDLSSEWDSDVPDPPTNTTHKVPSNVLILSLLPLRSQRSSLSVSVSPFCLELYSSLEVLHGEILRAAHNGSSQ